MNKRICLLAGVLSVCVAAPAAMAQQRVTSNPLYISGKVGFLDADLGGFDNAINIGVMVGYDLYQFPVGTVSVEGEFTTTLADGDIDGGGEWDADTLAAYGVYRSLGEFYFKGKAGVHRQDIKSDSGGPIPDAEDTTLAFGVGGGWRMDRNSGIEVEYTAGSDELDFVSVGYVIRF
jgi:hypothetical protein